MTHESHELDERDLEMVVGGSGNPRGETDGNAAGNVVDSGKATPILM
jgi:hypothetical protein